MPMTEEMEKPSMMTLVVSEMKELWAMAFPMTAMNCLVYLRAMVSVLCLGRLGPVEFAGGALSIGFTNITGYSVLFGLPSGLDPICSQSFGCGSFSLLSLSLQRTFLLLLIVSLPISLLWISLHPILTYFCRSDLLPLLPPGSPHQCLPPAVARVLAFARHN